ncbi:unnamed protein product, partial [Symbiodinium microadriaticum]
VQFYRFPRWWLDNLLKAGKLTRHTYLRVAAQVTVGFQKRLRDCKAAERYLHDQAFRDAVHAESKALESAMLPVKTVGPVEEFVACHDGQPRFRRPILAIVGGTRLGKSMLAARTLKRVANKLGLADFLESSRNREALQGRPKIVKGAGSATNVFSYSYSFCGRAVVVLADELADLRRRRAAKRQENRELANQEKALKKRRSRLMQAPLLVLLCLWLLLLFQEAIVVKPLREHGVVVDADLEGSPTAGGGAIADVDVDGSALRNQTGPAAIAVNADSQGGGWGGRECGATADDADLEGSPAADDAGGASCTRSQSQFGEELSVIQLLGWQMKRDGIYVEMGALDGVTYSNTLALRTCLGWTGMLIEGSPRHFQRLHQNYKDVESVIIKYGAVCAPPLTNATFSQGMSIGSIDGDVTYLPTGLRKRFSYRRQRVVVPCRPMEWYLQQLPKKHVDFVSLDVEGAELEVLLTMDFTEVLVEVFLIELHDWGRSEQTQSWKIRKLMRNLGYKECTNVHVWPNGLFVLQEGGGDVLQIQPCDKNGATHRIEAKPDVMVLCPCHLWLELRRPTHSIPNPHAVVRHCEMKSMVVALPHSILLCFAITVCATEHCEEELSTFQLLQVSQAVAGALDVPAGHVEAQREDVAQGFFHAVGSAEAAAVLQPGLIAERTFEEVFVTASSRQQQPVALTQKSAEAAVGTETICIIVGAVLLAVLVCLIFCCFRPSVSYEEASKEGQGPFIPAGAATLQRRPQNQDCC